jgi:hypothetical protein
LYVFGESTMLLTERAIRQLIYNILLEGVREDADALRTLLTDAPAALRQFEPLSMKPKWVNWLADRYVRNKYLADDTLEDALPVVAAFAAADAAISQKYGSNLQFKTAVDTSFPPSERKWNNPADAAAMSTADMDTLLTIYRRPKDKLGIDREDTSWERDEVGTFGPWKLYFPRNQQNSINIAGADPVTHRPYTTWCTARTSGENLFYSYTSHSIMLFYAINTEAPPQNQKSRISLGFNNGKLDVSGEYGGMTVDAANKGLKTAELKRIFGGYYASIIARAEEVIAKHGGKHPAEAEFNAAAKDPVKFNSMLKGLGDFEAGNMADRIFDVRPSPEVIAAAIRHKSPDVRVAVVTRKDTPEDIMVKLAGDPDARVRAKLVAKEHLPEALVVRLAGDPDANVRMNVSKRFVLSKDIMATLSRDPDARVRSSIGAKLDLPADIVVKFAEDPDAGVRAGITSRLDLPADIVVKLAEDPDVRVRTQMTSAGGLPVDSIIKLARDPVDQVREFIAYRSDLPEYIKAELARDPVARVREARRTTQKIHDDEIKRAARN